MTEKAPKVLLQELEALTALGAAETQHWMEISSRQIKCFARENGDEMTPDKHKVIEEMRVEWNFVKKNAEDLGKIAAQLHHEELLPALPHLVISDELWDVDNSGQDCQICEVSEKISDFQSAQQNAIEKLQEYCQ